MMNENKINEKEIKDELKDEVEYVALSELCDIIPGGTPDTSNESYWNGDIEWFTPTEVGLSKYVHHSARKISEAGLKNSSAKIIPANSILLTTRATIGNVSINKNECATNQGFQNVRPKNIEQLNYLYYGLEYLRESMNKLASGSTFKEISGKEVKKLMIKNMSIDESIKVGDLLSLIDDLIDNLNERINTTNNIKKSQVEVFLSNSDNFTKYKLSDVLTERKEMALDTEYEHVSLTKAGVVPKSERYNRDQITKDKESKKFKVTKMNDICYNPSNLKFDVICRNKYKDAIFSPIYVTFEVNQDFIPSFIEIVLCRPNFINYIRQYEEGTIYERMGVSSDDFLQGDVYLPSYDEQVQFAKYISMLNEQNNLLKERVEALKQIKQHYLNVIFK